MDLAQEIANAIQQAQAAINQERWDEAVAILQDALERYGSQQRLLVSLAKVLRLMSRYAEAISYLRMAQQQQPDDYYVLYELGVCLRNEAFIEEAIVTHSHLVDLYPEQQDARVVLARDFIVFGSPERVLDELRQLSSEDPSNHRYQLAYSEALIKMGYYTTALAMLEPLIEQEPDFYDVIILMAEAQFKLLRGDAWKDLARRAAALDPAAPFTLYWLARVDLAEGNVEQAVEQLNRVLELQPRFYRAYVALGELYQLGEHYEQAHAHLITARNIAPWDGEAVGALAAFRARQAIAIPNIDELIEFVAQRPYGGLQAYLGTILFNYGDDPARALALLESAVEYAPEDIAALQALGNAYVLHEHYQDAVTVLSRAVELNPRQQVSWTALGIAYMQQERFAEAREAYELALQHNAPTAALLYGYGTALLSLDHVEQALPLLQDAHMLDPEDGGILYSLACAHEALGDFAQAKELAAEAYTILGDDSDVLALLERLELVANLPAEQRTNDDEPYEVLVIKAGDQQTIASEMYRHRWLLWEKKERTEQQPAEIIWTTRNRETFVSYIQDEVVHMAYFLVRGQWVARAVTWLHEHMPSYFYEPAEIFALWEAAQTRDQKIEALYRVTIGASSAFDERTFAILRDVQHEPDGDVRRMAVWGMSYLAWPQVQALVGQYAASDPDPEVRAVAESLLRAYATSAGSDDDRCEP